MKNDHGVDAFYFHDKLGQVLRDLGSYKADELARALCRLAKVADENVLKEPEFAQQPAPPAAAQPDTVDVQREQLADAVVLFERVLRRTTSSDYEAAASACSRLRALLDGGAA